MRERDLPELDLVFEKVVDVQSDFLWRAWTEPDLLRKWFCPRPGIVSQCEIDLRPGGKFKNLMLGPEGQRVILEGCYLEIVPKSRLVWTTALLEGFRPQVPANENGEGLFYTVIITLENLGSSTRFTARVLHSDADSCNRHSKMGFHEGWGIALDQLVEISKER